MKNNATILLGIAAIIGLIGLSATPAFADTIYGALENNRVNTTVETKAIAVKHDSTVISPFHPSFKENKNDYVEFY